MTQQTEKGHGKAAYPRRQWDAERDTLLPPTNSLGQLWQWDRISLWWWHTEIKSSKIYQRLSRTDFFPDPDTTSGCCHTVPMWAPLPLFVTPFFIFCFLLQIWPHVSNYCHSHFCFTHALSVSLALIGWHVTNNVSWALLQRWSLNQLVYDALSHTNTHTLKSFHTTVCVVLQSFEVKVWLCVCIGGQSKCLSVLFSILPQKIATWRRYTHILHKKWSFIIES